MKKMFISSMFALVALFVLGSGTVFAHNQVVLPNAGLTPESNFYFLDRFGEALQQFFTFSPEGKAHLQITFAAERVAEIKVIFENKGIEAKGIKVAQTLLYANLASAATILADQKTEGKNVSALAKELNEEFAGPKTALEQTFKDEKQKLEAKEDELKAKIKEARKVGDTVQADALVKELGDVKAQKELLEQKEDEQAQDLDEQEEALEEQMEVKDEAAKKIREAEKEKAEIIREVQKEGLDISAEVFAQFDSLLDQAKAALASGKYEEAKELAKQAEKSLDAVENKIEDLQQAKEEEKELKEEAEEQQIEAEEKLKEADKESAEKIKEELKQNEEKLKEDQKKAKEEVKRAEENLRESEEER